MSNHLSTQTSPYLLQHAENPVDWFPWGEEALMLARQQDKPILISIGYSACHWCHVMEAESFEDPETAKLMNEHFINIKVDREERPDLDHLYMDAVQAMTGQGGWPLNVFLTPDTRPFFGGTYFPPLRYGQRPSWKEVLESVNRAYLDHKGDIEAQADNLMKHLHNANQPGQEPEDDLWSAPLNETAKMIRENILRQADTKWGGFGKAPKFPASFTIQYLLRDFHYNGEQSAAEQALLSLDKMICGGIYDQIGGGFCRYSTDEKWLVPHFEKMLYDNALLLNTLSEAFQLTHNGDYARVIQQTVDFLCRELQHPEGAFYAALDADSEGVEGKYYTWQKSEIEAILGEKAELFCLVYDVEVKGNWENTNILWLPERIETIAAQIKISAKQLQQVIDNCQQQLLDARNNRIHPRLDDKILLSWNAMLITALCKAYQTTGVQQYADLAQNAYSFLYTHLAQPEGGWWHTWKDGTAKIHAFLDDYAQIIQAAICLQEITGDAQFLEQAKWTTNFVLEHFSTKDNPFFYYTGIQESIILRKVELYDNATPSGNAVMAENLLNLSILLNLPDWRQRAHLMVSQMGKTIARYPTSFGVWCSVWQKLAYGIREIVVIGTNAPSLSAEVISHYIPNHLLQMSVTENKAYPLLAGKTTEVGKTCIYLCSNYSCHRPVETVPEFLEQLGTQEA